MSILNASLKKYVQASQACTNPTSTPCTNLHRHSDQQPHVRPRRSATACAPRAGHVWIALQKHHPQHFGAEKFGLTGRVPGSSVRLLLCAFVCVYVLKEEPEYYMSINAPLGVSAGVIPSPNTKTTPNFKYYFSRTLPAPSPILNLFEN